MNVDERNIGKRTEFIALEFIKTMNHGQLNGQFGIQTTNQQNKLNDLKTLNNDNALHARLR